MCITKMRKYIDFIVFLLFMSLLVLPMVLFGGKSEGKIERKSEEKAGFELMVKDGLVSLSAKDASLKEIIEEIGRSMKIEVIGNIPEEEKVNVKLDEVSLKDALEKLSSSHGFLMDSDYGDSKIAKIIILPKGKESMVQETESTIPAKHEPFKFEFNPMEQMEAVE